MQTSGKLLLYALLLLLPAAARSQAPASFSRDLENWHQQRIGALKAPNGWLNLTGLFWLKPGKNSFGSDPASDIVYSDTAFPAHAGSFELTGDEVSWTSAPGTLITLQDKPFSDGIIFQTGNNNPAQLANGHFRWNIIKRENKYGIRFRDLKSPALLSFKDVDRFPADSSWRLAAHLETSTGKSIFITNILGQTSAQQSPGKLVFSWQGKKYTLDAIDEGGEDLFIVFGDVTSGEETYTSGRFVYVKKPDTSGNTILDFNRAINPPCAFTPFATCPLPPPQNILPFPVNAGEKSFGHH
jgi:uncharacterized protein